jgi:hypothetical protein
MSAFPWSKACEARPVDDEASKIWRRGQNIQGVMPQNILGTARMVSIDKKWVYYKLGFCWTGLQSLSHAPVLKCVTAPFTQGSLFCGKTANYIYKAVLLYRNLPLYIINIKLYIDILRKGHYNLILQGNFERREYQR